MELLYIWIEDYKTLKHIGFNFSNDHEFDYSYVTGILDCKRKNKLLPEDFYPEKIKSVNAIIGDNGTGKTTFLHFLHTFLANPTCKSVIIFNKKDDFDKKVIQPYHDKELKVNLSQGSKLISVLKNPTAYNTKAGEQPLALEMVNSINLGYLSFGLNTGDFFGHKYTFDLSTAYFMRNARKLIHQNAGEANTTITGATVLPDYQLYLYNELLSQIDLVNEHPALIQEMFDKDQPLKKLTVFFSRIIELNQLQLNLSESYLNKNSHVIKFIEDCRNKYPSKYGWLNISDASLARVMIGVAILLTNKVDDRQLTFLQNESLENMEQLLTAELKEQSDLSSYHFYLDALRVLDSESITNIEDMEAKGLYHYTSFLSINFEISVDKSKDFIINYTHDTAWRVIGITEQALKGFEKGAFKYKGLKINQVKINRAHITDREVLYDEICKKHNRGEFNNPEEWWSYYFEQDKTVLALSSENNNIGNIKYIPIEMSESVNLFKNVKVGWQHKKAEEDFLRILYAKYQSGSIKLVKS